MRSIRNHSTVRALVLLAGGAAALARGVTPEGGLPSKHGHMRPDRTARAAFTEIMSRSPIVEYQPLTAGAQATAAGVAKAANFLTDVSTQGAARDQGSNGDCWVWASSAMAEVELKQLYGIVDRLSTQYVDALMNATNWANGGSVPNYVDYINGNGHILVPWSNANADYVDGNVNDYCTGSLRSTAQIQTSPSYTNVNLSVATLNTYGVGQASAIAAIKAALDNHHAVAWSFTTNFTGDKAFDYWWANSPETAILSYPNATLDTTGMTYDSSTWGAHMVAIVGYDDSAAAPASHYWLAINSWGLVPAATGNTGRPGGLLRLPMVMNYDATYNDSGAQRNYWFNTITLSADHPAPATPTVTATPATTSVVAAQPFVLTGKATGYPPFSYQWWKDGSALNGATSALFLDAVPVSGDSGSYDLVVTGRNGVPATSGAAQVTVASATQLLSNPGLETAPSGNTAIPGWTWTSTGLPAQYVSPYRTSSNAHTGTGYLFLGSAPDASNGISPASGTVYQQVAIPAGTVATLRYWARCVTQETDAADLDTLAVQVRNTSGTVLASLRTHSNQDVDHLLWAMESIDLSAYAGQTVQVCLNWNCTTTNQTFWRVDDLSLTVTAQAAVTSFLPTSAAPGQTVTLTGTALAGATAVAFNGTPAQSFQVVSDNEITAVVPLTATSGLLSVTTSQGTIQSAGAFTVLAQLPAVVTLTPKIKALLVGGTQSFSAGISGAPGTGLVWQLTGPGQLSTSSQSPTLYTAPAATGTVTLTASSLANGANDSVTFAIKTLDFKGQGIDVLCMATLAAAFGSSTGGADWFAPCDLDGNGTVNGGDVQIFIDNF